MNVVLSEVYCLLNELTSMQPNPPRNRDLTGHFLKGQSGNPGGRPVGFHSFIQERTSDGSELTDFVLSVFRDENASNLDRPKSKFEPCI